MDLAEDGQQRSEKPNRQGQTLIGLIGLTPGGLGVRDAESKKGVRAHHPKRLPL
jgi:hypothetical protein